MAEEVGDNEVAQAAYQRAIRIDPWLLESPFFHANRLRSEILERDYAFSAGAEIVNNLSIYQTIKSGDLPAARQGIEEALLINPRNSETIALLGLIEQMKGKVDLAFSLVQTAVFLAEMQPEEERNPRIYVWASEVALAQDKPDDAAAYIAKSFSIWINKWQYESSLYYYYVHHRPIQFHTFVLGYRRADFTQEMLSAFQWLMAYYRTEGMNAEATQMDSFLSAEGFDF
jgi:tetratricopeptide (TPR) repeat protein